MLVHVTRGGLVESAHHGRVAAVDAGGRTRLAVGDTAAAVYPRSTLKPVQALAMVESYGSLGPDPNERVVVISDLRMPGLDGMSLLSNLAGSPFDVRTILMTAFPDDGIRDRAMELGALACFSKPFELDALAEVVWHAIHDVPAANEPSSREPSSREPTP